MPFTKAAAAAITVYSVIAPFDPTGTAAVGALVGTAVTAAALRRNRDRAQERNGENRGGRDVDKAKYRHPVCHGTCRYRGHGPCDATLRYQPLDSALVLTKASKKIQTLPENPEDGQRCSPP
ncbi:hypothetical protein ACHAPT_012818 [Fusarium lateritium]